MYCYMYHNTCSDNISDSNMTYSFYAPKLNDQGILFLSCLSVCLFVCLFVCLSVFNFNLR